MKQLRCTICDDQQKEQDIIFVLLNKYMDMHGHVAKIDQFSSGEELLATDTSVYDLIILDIFMGEKTESRRQRNLWLEKQTQKSSFAARPMSLLPNLMKSMRCGI